MSGSYEIEKVDNGYIVTYGIFREIYHHLDDVFTTILLHFEDLAKDGEGELYGKVVIERGSDEDLQSEK